MEVRKIKTEFRLKKEARELAIYSEYNELMAQPGAMATAVDKYQTSDKIRTERGILQRQDNRYGNEIGKQRSQYRLGCQCGAQRGDAASYYLVGVDALDPHRRDGHRKIDVIDGGDRYDQGSDDDQQNGNASIAFFILWIGLKVIRIIDVGHWSQPEGITLFGAAGTTAWKFFSNSCSTRSLFSTESSLTNPK